MSRPVSAALFAILAGCGGGNDVNPRVIPGGGVGDPGIDGEVNVHVIDDETDEPIAGAMVHVGETIEGETDADGLFVATGVSGPQIITVIADDYTASTWFGADGANVTVPLSIAEPDTDDPPSATLTGTIDGWETMEPPDGQFLIALVGFSATNIDDDPANEITQPVGDGNLCFKAEGTASPCAWSLETRTGSQLVYALIGNAIPGAGEDFTIVFTDFAYASGVDVDDGDDQSGIELELAARNDLEDPDVTLPSAPSGTDTVAAAARLNLGDDGRLQIPLSGPFAAPAPSTSLFDGSTYDLVGFAGNDLDADPDANAEAESYRINRGLDSLEGESLGALLPLPDGIATDGTEFSFEAVEGASVQILEVKDTEDVGAWTAVILDGSLDVVRPDVVTLPDGTLIYTAQALEIPDLDLQDFSIDGIVETVTRASGDGVEFDN